VRELTLSLLLFSTSTVGARNLYNSISKYIYLKI
jgi:hypothetical protein